MQVPFAVDLFDSATIDILRSVFSSMLHLDVETTEAPWPPQGELITGTVFFTGTWKGATLIECTPDLARSFAARLMGIPKPPDINDDVLDSLGELANMVGGNLKAIVPPKVDISLPSVVRGVDYAVRICRGNDVSRQAFRSEDGVFWVSLVEMRPEAY